MNKKIKNFVVRLLRWVVVLGVLAAVFYFGGKLLLSGDEEEHVNPPVVSYFESSTKPMVMENDSLRFELDPTTTHFTVLDKKSGYQWLSNPADASRDPIALASNKSALESTLTVTYATSSGTVDLNNWQYSVEEGVYNVAPQEDGSIRVDYTVGRVEKVYTIPTAITVERFTAFMDKMGSKTAKKVKSNYTLYEPAKLESKANKDEIIAMYPEVVNQALYILKADTSENNKAKLQDYFVKEGGYTQEDFQIDQQLVAGSKTKVSAVYNVSVIYRLDGSDLVVEVPTSSIRYYADYPIKYLSILPMFGAAGTSDTGSMLVPEGGGSLIRYNNGKLAQNAYYANLYGWDYGSDRVEAITETRADFPVFGMTREEQNASFICILEEGSSWASVMADISGRNNSYNTVRSRHTIIHSDQYNISAKTAQLVYMYEAQVPDAVITQRYRFIDSANYVDMAAAYGDYLRATYPELREATVADDMPLHVELVGAIDKIVEKLGLPLESIVPVTTFEEAQTILGDLTGKNAAKNLSVTMSGWANGGITQKVLTRVKAQRQLGGSSGMNKLIAAADKSGVPLYFDGISTFAYDSGILQGFFGFGDAARLTTREQVKLYPFYEITYRQAKFRDPYYLVRPQYAQRMTDNLISALKEKKACGVAFRDIGYLLSANYNQKDTVTREEVLRMNVQSMQEAAEAGLKVKIKRGNAYAMPYADLVTDMDFKGLPYSLLDGSVPFYQIAIHGMKEYTSMPINLANDYETELLRCAEYGAGLSFTFMMEDGKVVQDSEHSYLYGAGYADWADKAAAIYRRYQQDMAGLNSQRIVGHAYLKDSVTVTRYENGAEVYVNYTSMPYEADGFTVEPRSYFVKGGKAE